MTKVAKIFLAEGFEESEALVPFDILKRGGVDVSLVSVSGSKFVTGAHGVGIETSQNLSDVTADVDLVMLPGGMPGTLNLGASEPLRALIAKCAAEGKIVSAICAAPSVLGEMGLLKGRSATCYPGFEGKLAGANYTGEDVVADGNFITAVGPGASFAFGLAILSALTSPAVAAKVKEQMILR